MRHPVYVLTFFVIDKNVDAKKKKCIKAIDAWPTFVSAHQSRGAASVSAYMSVQPLHPFLREIRTPIMQYEVSLQMHYLSV